MRTDESVAGFTLECRGTSADTCCTLLAYCRQGPVLLFLQFCVFGTSIQKVELCHDYACPRALTFSDELVDRT